MRIDGERFLEDVAGRLRGEIAAAGNPPVCLATVLISDDPRDFYNASLKHLWASKAGMSSTHLQLSGNATQAEVERAIDELARDTRVHGIFVQTPLPPGLTARAILSRIPRKKFVDGPVPATPLGIMRLLEYGGVRTTGVRAVIVGHSAEIAIPLAQLLGKENSVGLIDARSGDLGALTRQAEILVSAAEVPRVIAREHVKPGATVVDAGYNRTEAGVIGDVDLESVEPVAGAIVPMPGGIGPATIALLLEKTWQAAR